jgi:hypothetical protein
MTMTRYVPTHHPLCSCELCMLANTIMARDCKPTEAERRRAVAYMNRHGVLTRGKSGPDLDALEGKTVRFQWAHRTPDLTNLQSQWNDLRDAQVVAVDRGAVLLKAWFGAQRWWPFRAFQWIEEDPFDREDPSPSVGAP